MIGMTSNLVFCMVLEKDTALQRIRGGFRRIRMIEPLYRQHHLMERRSPKASDKRATSPSPHYAQTRSKRLRCGAVDILN